MEGCWGHSEALDGRGAAHDEPALETRRRLSSATFRCELAPHRSAATRTSWRDTLKTSKTPWIWLTLEPVMSTQLVPETLLKKRKQDAKAREERRTKAVEAKKVSFGLGQGNAIDASPSIAARVSGRDATYISTLPSGLVSR